MLVDPLPVKRLSTEAGTAITVLSTDSFALVDLSPGKTVRVTNALALTGQGVGKLTIAHSVSNESKLVPTDRLLVRIDHQVTNDDSIRPGNLNAFAYIVAGTPRGALLDDASTPYSTLGLIQTLLGVLAVSPTAATLSATNLNRIIAGEP
jgi:hypothetical protein